MLDKTIVAWNPNFSLALLKRECWFAGNDTWRHNTKASIYLQVVQGSFCVVASELSFDRETVKCCLQCPNRMKTNAKRILKSENVSLFSPFAWKLFDFPNQMGMLIQMIRCT